MTVKKRTWGNGKTCWEFCITVQKRPRKQYRRSGFRTKEQALQAEREAYLLLDTGKLNVASITFKEMFNIFIDHAEKNFAKATVINYKTMAYAHLGFFAHRKANEITSLVVQDWIDNVKPILSPYVLTNCIKLCKTVYNYCIKHDIVTINPFNKVDKVKLPKKIHNHLSLKEAIEMLDICKDVYPDFYPILAIAMFTGLRQGEIAGLKWVDIDFKKKTIYVRRQYTRKELKDDTKTVDSTRNVDMCEFVIKALLFHKQNSVILSEFVFVNQKGGNIDFRNIVVRRFKKLLEYCGYEKSHMRFHDLRGTFVDILLSKGVPVKYIQQQVGHTKISTTMDVYSNLLPEVNTKAIAILEEEINCEQIVSKYNPNKKDKS